MTAPQPLMQVLHAGGSLRYRPPHGFYVVLSGKTIPVIQSEAQAAVKAGHVRQAGISAHGVYVFSLNDKATDVRRVPDPAQALPRRPAAAPDALPDVHPLRCTLDSETPAAVSADGGAAPGAVPGRAGAVAGDGTRRIDIACDGKGNQLGGCAGCSKKGVTP